MKTPSRKGFPWGLVVLWFAFGTAACGSPDNAARLKAGSADAVDDGVTCRKHVSAAYRDGVPCPQMRDELRAIINTDKACLEAGINANKLRMKCAGDPDGT